MEDREGQPAAGAGGGWISVGVRFAAPQIWWGALWAALCGVLASGGFRWNADSLLRLALVLVLADPLMSQLCRLLFDADWTPDSRAASRPSAGPVSLLPYAEAGSPVQRLVRWSSDHLRWWERAAQPQAGGLLSGVVASAGIALLIGVALGPPSLWLVVIGLAALVVGLLLRPHWADGALAFRAVTETGIPWLVGFLAFGSLSRSAAVVAALYACLYWGSLRLAGGRGRIRAWPVAAGLVGFVVVALVVRQPVPAVLTALVAIVPAWLSLYGLASDVPGDILLRRMRPFVLVATLLAALAVGLAST